MALERSTRTSMILTVRNKDEKVQYLEPELDSVMEQLVDREQRQAENGQSENPSKTLKSGKRGEYYHNETQHEAHTKAAVTTVTARGIVRRNAGSNTLTKPVKAGGGKKTKIEDMRRKAAEPEAAKSQASVVKAAKAPD